MRYLLSCGYDFKQKIGNIWFKLGIYGMLDYIN